jgi:hypothetical protein
VKEKRTGTVPGPTDIEKVVDSVPCRFHELSSEGRITAGFDPGSDTQRVLFDLNVIPDNELKYLYWVKNETEGKYYQVIRPVSIVDFPVGHIAAFIERRNAPSKEIEAAL